MFTLHNGDCLQVMPSIPSGSIDAIITDLPYGTTACEWDSVIPLVPMWKEVKRVLKPNGVFITTAKNPFASVLILSNIEWFKYNFYWEKPRGANFTKIKWQPLDVVEQIHVFSGAASVFVGDKGNNITFNPQIESISKSRKRSLTKSDITKSGTSFLRKAHKSGIVEYSHNHPRNILYFSQDKDGRIHPTQKPVDLYRYLIRTYTNEGETVLDICMGSGTTIEAAIIEGRYSIGIEKDTEFGYFQIAEKRAKSAVLQQRLFTPSNNRLQPTAFGVGTQAQFPLLGSSQADESSATHGGG